ncbi:hypothetical protein MJN52_17835, partial [Salmonella enterica subsp. enterica serovar Kentucky]|nr:hypothetical protein [Salmonella enterica subsp. enterica serovar Kentucky]
QSSNATTLLVTSFVAQDLVALTPALVIVLGADVGTALMARILITIPLRKRPEDIKAIGLSLLTSFSQHYKRPALTLTPALWQELQRFAWPGNVRQLSNIIERLVLSIDHSPATLDEGRLLLDDLEEGSRREPTTCHDCQMLAGDYKTIRLRILRKLLEAERDNKSLVAKRLNVDRTSLTRWIRESA